MDERRRGAQLNRLHALGRLSPDQLSGDVLPIGDFAKIVPTMIGSAIALIEDGRPE